MVLAWVARSRRVVYGQASSKVLPQMGGIILPAKRLVARPVLVPLGVGLNVPRLKPIVASTVNVPNQQQSAPVPSVSLR